MLITDFENPRVWARVQIELRNTQIYGKSTTKQMQLIIPHRRENDTFPHSKVVGVICSWKTHRVHEKWTEIMQEGKRSCKNIARFTAKEQDPKVWNRILEMQDNFWDLV